MRVTTIIAALAVLSGAAIAQESQPISPEDWWRTLGGANKVVVVNVASVDPDNIRERRGVRTIGYVISALAADGTVRFQACSGDIDDVPESELVTTAETCDDQGPGIPKDPWTSASNWIIQEGGEVVSNDYAMISGIKCPELSASILAALNAADSTPSGTVFDSEMMKAGMVTKDTPGEDAMQVAVSGDCREGQMFTLFPIGAVWGAEYGAVGMLVE